MTYCSKCKRQNFKSAKFCVDCGATLVAETIIIETRKVVADKISGAKKWIIVSVISTAGICSMFYFFFLHNKQGKNALEKNREHSQAPGRYPLTSQRLLIDDDLKDMSKADLRIMRNEIYARHGLIFQAADMQNYFSAQSWYSAQYDNVINMLSNIEKNNIAMIRKYE